MLILSRKTESARLGNPEILYLHLRPSLLFFFLSLYLFIHERHPEWGRDTDRGRSKFLTRSLLWDSILGPGSVPEQKLDTQLLSHPVIPHLRAPALTSEISFYVFYLSLKEYPSLMWLLAFFFWSYCSSHRD